MSYTDNWNDDWRDELKSDHYDCWERLCDCRNLRRDLMVMAKLMKKYNLGKDPQDVLVNQANQTGTVRLISIPMMKNTSRC